MEVYQPATDQFVAVPVSWSVYREHDQLILLDNGKVLAHALMTFGAVPSEVYDPVTETVTTVGGAVPTPQADEMTKLLDGRVLVYSTVRGSYMFEPSGISGTWSNDVAQMPETFKFVRNSTMIALRDGRALLVGTTYDLDEDGPLEAPEVAMLYYPSLPQDSAGVGGGAYGGRLHNCTLAGNAASKGGGAAQAALYNCILYFNTAPEGPDHDSSSTLSHCCAASLPTTGVGNITNAPLFVDTNGWSNLRLQPGSPCINAGNNGYVTSITDLDGHPRILGGTVDMGAYEFVPPTPAELVEHLITQVNESDLRKKRPLLASLEAALASLQRGNAIAAVNQLHAFQNKVRAQVTDANLALAFAQSAGRVIEVLDGDQADKVAAKIHGVKRGHGGKMKLKFSGQAGQTCIVEASTNLVDWEVIGVAAQQADGSFEFEDADSTRFPNRFYRVVPAPTAP